MDVEDDIAKPDVSVLLQVHHGDNRPMPLWFQLKKTIPNFLFFLSFRWRLFLSTHIVTIFFNPWTHECFLAGGGGSQLCLEDQKAVISKKN